ncbi:hypothetical protein C8Q78DRAFT_124608 [Trametes maxima]|nr:hypothetical protein C8Q78DRAFT_124608 [Trametes maxima]
MIHMRAIPRPRQVSRRVSTLEGDCLAKQMGLTSSPEGKDLYYNILHTVGSLCERYFPHDQRFGPRSESRRILVRKAIHKHPILATYANAWPIANMLTMHRQLRRSGSRIGITNRRSTNTPVHRECRAKRPPRSCGNPIKRTRPSSTQPNKTSDQCPTQTPDGFSGFAMELPSLSEPGHLIQVFLRALPQDLSSLLPVFVEYGITDEASMRGVLRMAGWRRWLYGWVREGRLTELQFKMISDGFETLL